jgi:hypothetical protein
MFEAAKPFEPRRDTERNAHAQLPVDRRYPDAWFQFGVKQQIKGSHRQNCRLVPSRNLPEVRLPRGTQGSAVGMGGARSGGIGAFFFLAVFLRLRAGAPRFAFVDFFAMFSPPIGLTNCA